MPKRPYHPHWLLLTILAIASLAVLTACNGMTGTTPAAELADATPTVTDTAPSETQDEDQAPLTLQLETESLPAVDPACAAPTTAFALQSAPLPAAGLEPGVSYQFCVTGAPIGATITYTLTAPTGSSRTFTATSQEQDAGGTLAVLPLRLLATDAPGAYKLQASQGGQTSQLDLNIQAPSAPFIALNESIETNPRVIRASIGGLEPQSSARFALYSMRQVTPAGEDVEAGASEGVLLISTRLAADDQGIADLELDVADLPAGPYLLLLTPPGSDFGAPPVLRLPEQERLAALVNIARDAASTEPGASSSATPGAEAPAPATLPAALQPSEAPGSLPDTLQITIPPATLPACEPANTPTIQLWPTSGQIGEWWLGCLRGFGPSQDVSVTVNQANGDRSQLSFTTEADGNADFRWYSAPGEGSGDYRVQASSSAGRAVLNWKIDAPTRPHVLVYPHDFQTARGGDLYLSGFAPREKVTLGLYRLNDQGQATLVKRWPIDTNKYGAYNEKFSQLAGVKAGAYALIAQGKQAYTFPGISVPASAVDFFSINTPLDSRYDSYTLYVGRQPGTLSSDEAAPSSATPATATPTSATPISATVAPTSSTQIPAPSVLLAEDTSGDPTCPGATAGEPAICLLPTSMPQGTFAYMLMHGFPAQTSFNVTVTPPQGDPVSLAVSADDQGLAEAHWYALHDEPLGEYKVKIEGGGQTFDGAFTVAATQAPRLIVQPRAPEAGAPVLASMTGFQPGEKLIVARYRRANTADGSVQFELADSTEVEMDSRGGSSLFLRTGKDQKGDLFLLTAYRPNQADPAAQAMYSVGVPLRLRYPLAWGQNDQEGQ